MTTQKPYCLHRITNGNRNQPLRKVKLKFTNNNQNVHSGLRIYLLGFADHNQRKEKFSASTESESINFKKQLNFSGRVFLRERSGATLHTTLSLVCTVTVPYLKKSEAEFTASVSGKKKRSKTHKRLKERFLIGRNMTKRANFRGSPLFQATYNINVQHKHRKTNNSTSLVSVRFLCLFFSFYVVRSLKKRISWKICTFCHVSSN